jgi:mannosyltransferase
MAKKAKEKRTKKDAGDTAGEASCDLESPAPATPGLTGLVNAVRTSRYLQLLLLLTLLGAFLRLSQLGTASLWLDEASTLTFARRSIFEIWGALSGGEFNPPLFYWVEHAMLALGESEVALRLIPAILGILTIPVFYLIGTELLDRNTGILAAALLAFSPFQIYYSQEARAYAPMLFFYSLAFWFFLRLLRSWDRRDALLFGILAAVAFWTHFYAFVPVLALFLFALGLKARELARDLRTAIPLGISLLAFVILSLPLIWHAVQLFFARTGAPPSFGVQGFETITQTLVQLSGFSAILAWVFLALFIAGVAALWPRDRVKALLLVFILVFPLLLSVFLSYRMPMVPRYLIYLLAAFLPGVALALRPLCPFVRSRNLVYGAVILALLINLPVLVPSYTTPQKDDWRGLSQQLTARAGAGDLVIALPGYNRQPLNYYYNNGTAGTLEFGFSRVADLEAALAQNPGRTAWFIVTGDIYSADPGGQVVSWLGQQTTLAWKDANGGLLLLRYSG